MCAANPAEKLRSQHRCPEQARDCVVALVHPAAHTALPESPAAFPWRYFLHPSAQGRRLAWERLACKSAFFPGFICLPVQPGQCPVWGCPTFPQHLHAGGFPVRQLGRGSGNNLQRGESGTCHVSAGCFATPACCREVPPSEDPKAVDVVVPRDQHPRKKSLPPLPLFLCCILNFFCLWLLHHHFLRPPHLVVVEMRTRWQTTNMGPQRGK